MDDALEGPLERVRHHRQRPLPSSWNLL